MTSMLHYMQILNHWTQKPSLYVNLLPVKPRLCKPARCPTVNMWVLNLITLLLTSLQIWSARRRRAERQHQASVGFLQNEMWQYESAPCECWVCNDIMLGQLQKNHLKNMSSADISGSGQSSRGNTRNVIIRGKEKLKTLTPTSAWKPEVFSKRQMRQLLIFQKRFTDEQKHACRSWKATYKDQIFHISDPTSTHTSQHKQQSNTNPTKAAWWMPNYCFPASSETN